MSMYEQFGRSFSRFCDPTQLAEFGRLLQAFLATDNLTRKQAEKAFLESKTTNPAVVAACLAELLTKHADEGLRSMACVLLRQLCVARELWFAIPRPFQEIVKSNLITCLRADPSPQVRRRACWVIAQVCSNIPDGESCESSWAKVILPLCFEAIRAPEASHRLIGFFLLSKVLEFSPDECIKPVSADILSLTGAALSDAEVPIRVHAVKSIVMFVSRMDSPEVRTALTPALIPMLMLVSGRLSAGDEGSAQEVLEALIDLAKIAPGLLKPQMENVAQAMANIASSSALDTDTRKLATEFLVSYVEALPGAARKSAIVTTTALRLSMLLMSLSDDDDNWVNEEYNLEGDADPSDPGDGDECAMVGSEALTRLSAALRGDVVVSVSAPVIQTMLGLTPVNPAAPVLHAGLWQGKRAGLAALGFIALGCKKAMSKDLKTYAALVLSFLADANQRVRHAALGTLALFAEAFAGNSKSYANMCGAVLPSIIAAISSSSGNSARVRVHGVTALIALIAQGEFACPLEAVMPHLEAALRALAEMMALPTHAAKYQTLDAVSSIAVCVDDAFLPYYSTFISGIHAMIASPATSSADVTVKGKALQCLAAIGEAVGKEKFAADGAAAMEVITKWHAAGQLAADDTFAQDVLTAATKICKTLGELSKPYLPVILPKLFDAVNRDLEFTCEDVEEGATAASSGGLSSTIYDIKGAGLKRISMNVAALQEREAACRMLFEFASNLENEFMPYVEATFAAIKPLLGHRFHTAGRNISTLILPHLFSICVHAPEGAGLALAPRVLVEGLMLVIDAAMKELDPDTRVAQVECVKDCMYTCANYPTHLESKPGCSTALPPLALPLEQAEQLIQALVLIARASIMRRVEGMQSLGAKEDADQHDAEALDEEMETEEDLMEYCVDGMGYLLKMHRDAFLPIFEKYMAPAFEELLSEKAPDALLWNGLCVYVDVIEWCGPAARAHYVPKLLPLLVKCIRHDYPNIRQCAVYGIGQLVLHAPAMVAPVLSDVLAGIVAVVQAEGARDPENNSATENAVATMGKILSVLGSSLPAGMSGKDLGLLWLSSLPLREDEMEAQDMHSMLASMAQARHPLLMEDPAAATHVVRVFCDVLVGVSGGGGDDEIEMATSTTKAQMVEFLKGNAPLVQACWPTLTPAQQSALRTLTQ